jgi:hypothetical protein
MIAIVGRPQANFAQHCGFAIVPARPRKPREKRRSAWIVALRHRKFISLEDLQSGDSRTAGQTESSALP